MNKELKSRIILKFGTQTDFANHLKIPESTVSRIINRRRELNQENKESWAKILDTEIDNIFTT